MPGFSLLRLRTDEVYHGEDVTHIANYSDGEELLLFADLVLSPVRKAVYLNSLLFVS